MTVDRWRPFGASVSRLEPFHGMSDIQSEMNRLFDSFFGRPGPVATAERTWLPLFDMWETKEDLLVALELPGIREKDVNVSITGDILAVKGERAWDQAGKDGNVHRTERVFGKFERIIPLPVAVQADKVKAAFRDGVLEIRLPKVEAIKPKEIKIDVA
jgi:HSP20 family protein